MNEKLLKNCCKIIQRFCKKSAKNTDFSLNPKALSFVHFCTFSAYLEALSFIEKMVRGVSPVYKNNENMKKYMKNMKIFHYY